MNKRSRWAYVGSCVLTFSTFLGVIASLMTLNNTEGGGSFLSYLIWYIGGALSTIAVMSFNFLPWRGVSTGIAFAGTICIAFTGTILGIIHPLMLMLGDHSANLLLLVGSALVLWIGLMLLVLASLLSRMFASAPLWCALGALLVALAMGLTNILPPIAGALPYIALMLVSVSVIRRDLRLQRLASVNQQSVRSV